MFYESRFFFAFLHQCQEAHHQTCYFSHRNLENKSIRSQLRPAGHVASQSQFFSCMSEINVAVFLFLFFFFSNFLLLLLKYL